MYIYKNHRVCCLSYVQDIIEGLRPKNQCIFLSILGNYPKNTIPIKNTFKCSLYLCFSFRRKISEYNNLPHYFTAANCVFFYF